MLYASFLIATTVVKIAGGKQQLKLLGKIKQKQRERPDQSVLARK